MTEQRARADGELPAAQDHGSAANSSSATTGTFGIPVAVQAAAAWSWRALLIGAVVYFAVRMAAKIGLVILALFAGLLVTALLRPMVDWLAARGLPRLAGAWLTVLGLLAATLAVIWYIAQRAIAQIQVLRFGVGTGLERLRDLLVDATGLSRERVNTATQQVIDQFSGGAQGESFSIPIVQSTGVVVAALAAAGLALFSAFWFTYDGERVWERLVVLFPRPYREAADGAGRRAWTSLGGYLRGVTIVALIDAVGVGIALVVLGVPMPLALAVLTFIGGFVPLVGATVAGMAAVLVALAAEGVTTALLTLGAVLLVQQIEGQLLAPLVMGRSVRLHPLAIAYVITAGGLLYGLAGAVIAVPIAAVVHTVGTFLADRSHDVGRPTVGGRLGARIVARRMKVPSEGSGSPQPQAPSG